MRIRLLAPLVITATAAFAQTNPASNLPPPSATEQWEPVPLVVSAPAGGVPGDAVALFDGAGLDAWDFTSAKEPRPLWTVKDGVLTPVDKTGSLRTKQAFGDVQLHLEFRSPVNPLKSGQQRGNSGVLFMGLYELQVLDSHDNPTYVNGQAASIYKQHPPLVNASRKPGEWQVYDAVFVAPRFGADGTLLSPARMTVFHNGVLVQHDAVLLGATEYRGAPSYKPHAAKLPLVLQNHPVDRPSFRNIWVREISLPEAVTGKNETDVAGAGKVLPAGKNALPPDHGVHIQITDSGAILFDHKSVAESELPALLKQARNGGRDLSVLITASEKASVKTVSFVMDECHKAGVRRINLQTRAF